MNREKREIVTVLTTAIVILTAAGLFLYRLYDEKQSTRTDPYSLIASSPEAIVCINRPGIFAGDILSRKPECDLFTAYIPEIYLSLIRQASRLSPVILSFHAQGAVLYMRADEASARRLEQSVLQKRFNAYAPQRQEKGGIVFTYYPDAGNRFFGYYYHNHVWVAGYSRKLIEEVARIQSKEKAGGLQPEQTLIRRSLDTRVPLNILIRTDALDLSVGKGDSAVWRLPEGWMGVELFMNEKRLNYVGYLTDGTSCADSLYSAAGDTFALRIEQRFPQFRVCRQMSRDNGKIFYSGYLIPSGKKTEAPIRTAGRPVRE